MFTQVGPLLIYFAGGWLIISRGDPTLTVGTITATVALINRLYRPVESLLNIQVDWIRSMAMFTPGGFGLPQFSVQFQLVEAAAHIVSR